MYLIKGIAGFLKPLVAILKLLQYRFIHEILYLILVPLWDNFFLLQVQQINVCRFCLDVGIPSDPLIRPCTCTGASRFMHASCLNIYRQSSSIDSCPVCRSVFRYTAPVTLSEIIQQVRNFILLYAISPRNVLTDQNTYFA